MAHIAASIAFVNAPPLYLPRRYAIANARGLPRCSVPFAARMAANRSRVFLWHLHVLPPIRGFAHLIRNKVDTIEQIQATVFSNQICS